LKADYDGFATFRRAENRDKILLCSHDCGWMDEIMRKRPLVPQAVFLQAVIAILAIGALALLLWEPRIEGRNAHATLFAIYCKDPFLAFAYLASIPFFIALYQAFKAAGYLGKQNEFPQAVTKALRTIKVCALATIGFVAVGELFIMLGDSDDRAGGFFMGILISFGALIVAIAAARLERSFRTPRV
jgi:hypothetical protein